MADGIDRVMRHLDMIAGPVPAVPQDRPQIVTMWVPVAGAGGLWYPAKGLSDPVKAGEPLGTIRDVFGAICETIVSKHDGFVLYRLSSLAVNAGEVLMGVATPVGTSPGADAITGGQ